MRSVLFVLLVVVSGCTTVGSPGTNGGPTAGTEPFTAGTAALRSDRPAPGGNFFVIDQPIAEVHTILRAQFTDLELIVSSDHVTGVDGRFGVSSANAAVVVVTTALSPTSTRLNIYSNEYVSDGRNSRVGDARFRYDLQAILVGRLAEAFHAVAGTIPDKVG
jgi:hypothetical protein